MRESPPVRAKHSPLLMNEANLCLVGYRGMHRKLDRVCVEDNVIGKNALLCLGKHDPCSFGNQGAPTDLAMSEWSFAV